MTHLESINKGLDEKTPYLDIIRKVYLTYPTMAFIGDEERQFSILNEIALYFGIAISCVHVAGSAKTGMSFHKNTPFTPKKSDLDIAIIDPELFRYYSEWAFKKSSGFTNTSVFPVLNGLSTAGQYKTMISKGMFRPDLMPNGNLRANWKKFFGSLSYKHKDLFDSINAGIYFSTVYFEQKQISIINEHISNQPT
jgi:hypothetical protein